MPDDAAGNGQGDKPRAVFYSRLLTSRLINAVLVGSTFRRIARCRPAT